MNKKLLYIAAAFFGLTLWYASDVSEATHRQQNIRLNELKIKIVTLENQQKVFQDAMCHELNMRASRPSAELSHEDCMKFFTEISRDAAITTASGTFPDNILTPTPAPCDMPHQLCGQKEWLKTQWEYWRSRR